MKKITIIGFSFLFLLIIIPMIFQAIFLFSSNEEKPQPYSLMNKFDIDSENIEELFDEIIIYVMRTNTQEIQEILLEDYVVGVVAAEMPARFESEALKAQAVAARTYGLRILRGRDYLYDTVDHQVFKDVYQLEAKWGDGFDYYYNKIRDAVYATKGLVMKYDDDLIEALFFAMSNGMTENSEDIFSRNAPYLRSVNSEWDRNGNNFEVTRTFNLSELRNIFDNRNLMGSSFNIMSLTEAGSVNEVNVGGTILTGPEFRRRLGLRSSAFTIANHIDSIKITTLGHGHGVGMSQVGANQMALMGKDFMEILHHYYQGVNIIQKRSLD